MLPLQLDELSTALTKLKSLLEKPLWEDGTWRENVATAAKETEKAGRKLSQFCENSSDMAELAKVGQEAELAGKKFSQALGSFSLGDVIGFTKWWVGGVVSLKTVEVLAMALGTREALKDHCVNYYLN